MNRRRTNATLNVHDILHDHFNELERMDFLIAEVANLTLEQQGRLIVEAFGKMQDYVDMKKMSVEVLRCEGDEYSITTIN